MDKNSDRCIQCLVPENIMSIKEGYAYCVKCTCNVFKERIKIIDVFVLYDSTTPKLQKIRLTTVTNNYYLYCTTFVMRLTFESLKIMAMIGFGILLIMILSIIIIFN